MLKDRFLSLKDTSNLNLYLVSVQFVLFRVIGAFSVYSLFFNPDFKQCTVFFYYLVFYFPPPPILLSKTIAHFIRNLTDLVSRLFYSLHFSHHSGLFLAP